MKKLKINVKIFYKYEKHTKKTIEQAIKTSKLIKDNKYKKIPLYHRIKLKHYTKKMEDYKKQLYFIRK